ncbi:MAG: DNA repair protein RadC [Deltaproteobacteria bacterium]|nr:DNA repair protein RadC [Deltaproteobacteria bacterium]
MIDLDTADTPLPLDTPHERLRRLGPDALSDAELLGILLEHGRTPAASVRFSNRVLEGYGGLRSLHRAGFGELAMDLGARRALRLIAAGALSARALCEPLAHRTVLRSSRDVHAAYFAKLASQPDEQVLAVLLDVKQRPVAERTLARGGPTGCAVSIRAVFALAVREGAAGVVLVHNHPSGDPTPSDDDLSLTRHVRQAGSLLDLPLVDHVILGRDGVFSFLDAGLLEEPLTIAGAQ